MDYQFRRIQSADAPAVLEIYRLAARQPEGLARRPEEVTEDYISDLIEEFCANGVFYVATSDAHVIGFIHALASPIEDLHHVMSQLTIAIHPEFQGKGLGKRLFSYFLNVIKKEFRQIYRVELRARASNQQALALYRSLGFVEEGRFTGRIRARDGSFEDGIPMVWFNPGWKPQARIKPFAEL